MSNASTDRVLPYETPKKQPYQAFGKQFFMVLILSAIAVVVMMSFVTPAPRNQQAVRRAMCSANLKSIGTALQKYANDNGDCYPDSIFELANAVQFPPETVVCPASNDHKATSLEKLNEGGHISYIYLGKGRKRADVGMDDPLVYEPLSNHKGAGANVLFGDTHVEWLTPAELAKVLAAPTTLPTTTPSTMPTK